MSLIGAVAGIWHDPRVNEGASMNAVDWKRGIGGLAGVTALLLSLTLASPGQAAMPLRLVRAANRGIPALVKPGTDLGAQLAGPEATWVDSIFIAGRVRGGGHKFGILVHTLTFPNAGQRTLYVSIVDQTTGWYRNYEATIPQDQYSWSRKRLRIRMPGLTWSGNARQMQLKARTPWGSLRARFTPEGPVLNYSGAGLIDLLGDVNYEYAFPAMRTVGTLTAEGKTRRMRGTSWLDRQWGPVPVTDPSMRWTWMNITLSNGDQLAIWDVLDNAAQSSWVTVLRPDGSYALASVKPLARGASAFWTSPITRKTYPTRWRIDIPALGGHLSVAVTGPRGQEFRDGHVEATAAVAGIYNRARVTGTTFVEMNGAWTAPRRRR